MIKDEMKNKISMELKNPVTAQGFEIICKNLTELEKENAELKEKLNFSTQYYQGEKAKKQLTKAKVLLTRFVMASVHLNGKEQDLVKETEQFLKEE